MSVYVCGWREFVLASGHWWELQVICQNEAVSRLEECVKRLSRVALSWIFGALLIMCIECVCVLHNNDGNAHTF